VRIAAPVVTGVAGRVNLRDASPRAGRNASLT
jgi:hypothetical protein